MSEPGSGSEESAPHNCVMGNLMPWQRLETAAKVAEEAFHWPWWQTEGLTMMVGPEERSPNTKNPVRFMYC